MKGSSTWLLGASLGAFLLITACKGQKSAEVADPADQTLPVSRGGRCPSASPSRLVMDSHAAGAQTMNIRRVFLLVGEEQKRVLICREADTNFDGTFDVYRSYSDQGEKLTEEADTDYNGRVDTWIYFQHGAMSRLELDTSDRGRPNETRLFSRGNLVRIEKDSNNDGKSDIFEIYDQGDLLRRGQDFNHDGHVDSWQVDRVRESERLAQSRAAESGAQNAAGNEERPSEGQLAEPPQDASEDSSNPSEQQSAPPQAENP